MKKVIIFSIICIFLFNSCAFLNLRIDDDFYNLPKEHQKVIKEAFRDFVWVNYTTESTKTHLK